MTERHGGNPARVVDASLTLINEVYRRPLDPGYAEAAARRAAGATTRSVPRVVVLLVLAVVLGLGVVTATRALRQPTTSAVAARTVLEKQIQQRSADATATQDRITALGGQIAQLQEDVLGSGASAVKNGATDAVAAGAAHVSGPGLRLVLTDAPSDHPDTQDPADRVQDVDLQVAVNGLWAAGAEAIAINGERLTSTAAIRAAGDAVLVDLVALSSPYTIEAIGDAGRMQADLARTSAGEHLATLRSTYGIGVTTTTSKHLDLPGTGQVVLQYARPVDGSPGAADGAAGAVTDNGAVPTGRTEGAGA